MLLYWHCTVDRLFLRFIEIPYHPPLGEAGDRNERAAMILYCQVETPDSTRKQKYNMLERRLKPCKPNRLRPV